MPTNLPTQIINLSPLKFSFYRTVSLLFCFTLVFLEIVDFSIHLGYVNSHPIIKPILRGAFLFIFICCIFDIDIIHKNLTHFAFIPLTLLAFIFFTYALAEKNILNSLYYVTRILFWICGTIFVYRMLITGSINKKNIENTINAIIIIYSIFIFYIFFISGARFSQNIGIYTLLWCVPFLMIQERSKSKTLLIGLAYWTIFITFKRGACFALILSSFIYALSYSFLERNIKATFNCLLIILILLLLFIVSLKIVQQVRPQFFDRRTADLSNKETIGSGRGSFYPMLFSHYLNHSNPINFFLGFGSRSVQKLTPGEIYAHSDWLQILHDFGLLGMILFFGLHISIIKLIYKSFKAKFRYTPALIMNYTMFFLLNIFSGMVFFPTSIFFGMFISLYYYLWVEKTKIVSNRNDHLRVSKTQDDKEKSSFGLSL